MSIKFNNFIAFKVLSYDELCACNELDTDFMYLYVHPMKKDGTVSGNIRKILELSGMLAGGEFKVIEQ